MADRKPGLEQGIPAQFQFFDPSYVAMIGDFYARWFESAMKVSQEIAEIAQMRIKDEIAAWSKVASCRDPREFVEYQRDHVKQVAANAAEDVAKVSSMITNMIQDSAMKKAA